MKPLAEFDGLRVQTPSGATALGPLAAALEPGRIGIAGRSGGGKSTLLRFLAGRLPDGWNVEGSAWTRGHRLDGHRALPGAALVSQDAQSGLDPVARVGRLLRWAGGTGRQDAHARAAVAALGLDFDRVAALRPAALSGGMRQRVLVAMGLLRAERVLLLDEAASALDPASAERVAGAVDRWTAAEPGRLAIHTSHDLDWLGRHCDRVWVLDRGELAEEFAGEPRVAEPASPARARLTDAVDRLRSS